MTDVTLEAMVRRIASEAERMFNKHGSLPMMWLVDAPDKGIAMITTPPPEGEDDNAAKNALATGMREFFREHNVTRYARACEVWFDEVPKATSELRDDEGREFITDVPGAPLQIVGRRGLTGDLHPDHFYCPPSAAVAAEAADIAREHGAEVVTGPEANDLINAFEIGPDGQLRPRRIERVMIDGEDSDQYLYAFRDIVRPATGKPYLTPLSKIERPAQLKGRLVGLLPKDGILSQ